MKQIRVDGRRYLMSWNEHHQRVRLTGSGLLAGVYLPAGVFLSSPRPVLADAARVAVADYRRRHTARNIST